MRAIMGQTPMSQSKQNEKRRPTECILNKTGLYTGHNVNNNKCAGITNFGETVTTHSIFTFNFLKRMYRISENVFLIYIIKQNFLCVCQIITQEPLDRFASYFDWGTWENHGKEVLKLLAEKFDIYLEKPRQCQLQM